MLLMKFDHQSKDNEKTHSGRSHRPISNLCSTHQQITGSFCLVDLATNLSSARSEHAWLPHQ